MMTIDTTPYVQFAETLADASGEVIRNYYRSPLSIDCKDDTSPVTIADREAEQAIRALIETQFPEHGIIGEEFGSQNEKADYQWIIDPIDGTKSFMIGRPIFGTLIALAYKGKPILGVIDQPITRERWIGGGNYSTRCNGVLVKTRPCDNLSQAVLCTTAHDLFSAEEKIQFDKVATNAKYVVYGGDCYSYALLAMGLVDVVMESGLQPYDFAALAPVVQHAGGSFTDWNGKMLTLCSGGQVIATGNSEIRSEIDALLSQ